MGAQGDEHARAAPRTSKRDGPRLSCLRDWYRRQSQSLAGPCQQGLASNHFQWHDTYRRLNCQKVHCQTLLGLQRLPCCQRKAIFASPTQFKPSNSPLTITADSSEPPSLWEKSAPPIPICSHPRASTAGPGWSPFLLGFTASSQPLPTQRDLHSGRQSTLEKTTAVSAGQRTAAGEPPKPQYHRRPPSR